MNNPLRHVGQTAHPDPSSAEQPTRDAAAQPVKPDDARPGPKLGQHPTTTDAPADTPAGKPTAPAPGPQPPNPKDIKDLQTGEPPPESSAGS